MKKKPQRVAMVGYTFYASDGRLKRHVAALLSAGFTVDVIALANTHSATETEQEGVRFFLPMSRRYNRGGRFRAFHEYLKFSFLCCLALLRNHLFHDRYTLVHINNMPNFLVFAATPLRALGVPVILDMHDTMPEIYQERFDVGPDHWMIRALRLEERLSVRQADFILAATHTELARVEQNVDTRGRSLVILNLPDPEIFPLLEPQATLPSDQRDYRLVYHGTLARRLGVDIAIRAMAHVRDARARVRLEVYGDGEDRLKLLQLREELELTDCVFISDGFVPIEELPAILAGADLAVLPSRDNVATELMLPTKLLEYIRLGIPCVTTPTRTIHRYLDESMIALAEPENPHSVADAILRLLDQPEERLALVSRSREFFREHSLKTEQQRYLKAVRALTGGESEGDE